MHFLLNLHRLLQYLHIQIIHRVIGLSHHINHLLIVHVVFFFFFFCSFCIFFFIFFLCLLILLIPSNMPLILLAVSFISSFKSPLILPSSLERWLNVSATASPRSATTDRAPLSSGSFERS